ncbi:universal stress protein [Kitasatospora sp. NPDC049258]|uniref:universal stress protein n=1 Tax=Kitasatospora sp. NPDC049258 TaxID=3155394 RepID=UPI003432D907
MNEQGEPQSRIVVGVDGSPASIEALRWAVDQARGRGARIEALIAWQYPVATGWSVPLPPVAYLADTSRKVLDAAVAEAVGADGLVGIRAVVVEGGAASCLLDAARGADLLVVGSRGHGGFTGALLGSVSQHCVQHAPCPVVVVRHARS